MRRRRGTAGWCLWSTYQKPHVRCLQADGNGLSSHLVQQEVQRQGVSGLVASALLRAILGPGSCHLSALTFHHLVSPEAGSGVADVTSRRKPGTISPQGNPLGIIFP